MIAIIDYGMGNLRSVQKALEKVGAAARIIDTPDQLGAARGLVLPGVGAFGQAMERLIPAGFDKLCRSWAAEDRPFLGICLGMQLLFTESEEFGPVAGLDIVPGRVIKFTGPAYAAPGNESGLKVPHMGWNQIKVVNPHPVVADLPADAMTYFVHSYYPVPDDPSWTVLTSDHGCEFTAAVGRGNLFASQFHPEKSGAVGLGMLANFVTLVERGRIVEILPAIDLRGGRCVRLIQGDYSRETVFADDPAEMARHWESLGAKWLHVVDLEGAKDGEPKQLDTVAAIARAVSIPVELGGGIRTEESARRALDLGVNRIIVGTAALDREMAGELAAFLGPHLVAGIDARDGNVAVRGWLETTETRAVDLAKELVDLGVGWIVYTDIAVDGMLTGANIPAMREMVAAVPQAKVIASGGVSTVEDIRALRDAGCAGAIIGMALYTGKLRLEDALEAAC